MFRFGDFFRNIRMFFRQRFERLNLRLISPTMFEGNRYKKPNHLGKIILIEKVPSISLFFNILLKDRHP